MMSNNHCNHKLKLILVIISSLLAKQLASSGNTRPETEEEAVVVDVIMVREDVVRGVWVIQDSGQFLTFLVICNRSGVGNFIGLAFVAFFLKWDKAEENATVNGCLIGRCSKWHVLEWCAELVYWKLSQSCQSN